MGNRPNKQSNFVGINKTEPSIFFSDIDKDLKSLFNYLQRNPRFYSQNNEPTLGTNEFAFWADLDGGPA